MYLTLPQNKVKMVLASYKGDWKKVEFSLSTKGGSIGFGEDKERVKLNLETCPQDYIELLMRYGHLTETQKALIISETGIGIEQRDFDQIVTAPVDLFNAVVSLGRTARNAEMFICGRYYPITLCAEYKVDEDHNGRNIKRCTMYARVNMAGDVYTAAWTVTDMDFRGVDGVLEWSTTQLFERFHLKLLEQDLTAYDARVLGAQRLLAETGRLMDCTGYAVVVYENAHFGMSTRSTLEFGTLEVPKKVIVDARLENAEKRNEYGALGVKQLPDPLPFVRVFHMETKRWGFVDECELEYHEFDAHVSQKLVLPADMRTMLHGLFNLESKKLFGDVLKEKHGGLIILASGPPGVGKTLTAEVFAEVSQRPLYVMEMNELGIDVKGVEEALTRVFARVVRWNAILLFDEADVFLSTRGSDLTQSVLVGIFLRLMDYYHGLLFLTSNRPEVIDPAFKSRITLHLQYPELDLKARQSVWNIMLIEAGLPVGKHVNKLAQHELNGRQIRNLVRLMRAVHGVTVTPTQMEAIIAFACR